MKQIKKPFRIMHPVGGVLNHDLKRGLYEFEVIYDIEAKSLIHAFRGCQNDFNESYAKLNKRSTSVGDIIIDLDEQICYMITGRGFIEIPPTVAQYIDWSNH